MKQLIIRIIGAILMILGVFMSAVSIIISATMWLVIALINGISRKEYEWYDLYSWPFTRSATVCFYGGCSLRDGKFPKFNVIYKDYIKNIKYWTGD